MNKNISFPPDIHSQLTSEANNDFLNPEQLSTVILGNILQDIHQVTSKFHFDNCTFKQGQAYIENQWALIEHLNNKFDKESLCCFGQLLHTVQDFYSHSNWVELHQNEEGFPIWNLDLNNLPAGIFSGTFKLGSPKCCAAGTPTHKELNKDNPDSIEGKKVVKQGPNEGKTLFELAYKMALKATKVQFERFKAVDSSIKKSSESEEYSKGKRANEILSVLSNL